MRIRASVVVLSILLSSIAAGRPADAKVQRSGPLLYVTESAISRDGIASPNVDAVCPSGSKAVGAGAAFSRPSGAAPLSNIRLNGQPGAEGQGFNGSGGDRKMTAVAVCLREPFDASVVYVFFSSSGTLGSGAFTPTCAAGRTPLGGGAGVTPAALGRVLLDSFPSPTGWVGAFTGPLVANSTFLVVRACVDEGIFEVSHVERDGVADPGTVASAKAKCPKRMRVVGGGVDTSTTINVSRPIDLPRDRDKVPDDGWLGVVPNGTASPQPFTVHAVCIKRV